MLSEKLKALGVEPLKQLVNQLGTWPLTSPSPFPQTLDLESTLVKLSLINMGPLLNVWVDQDNTNSSMFITWVGFRPCCRHLLTHSSICLAVSLCICPNRLFAWDCIFLALARLSVHSCIYFCYSSYPYLNPPLFFLLPHPGDIL